MQHLALILVSVSQLLSSSLPSSSLVSTWDAISPSATAATGGISSTVGVSAVGHESLNQVYDQVYGSIVTNQQFATVLFKSEPKLLIGSPVVYRGEVVGFVKEASGNLALIANDQALNSKLPSTLDKIAVVFSRKVGDGPALESYLELLKLESASASSKKGKEIKGFCSLSELWDGKLANN